MDKTAKNDITGDRIQSKTNSDSFRDNFDRIFKKTVEEIEQNPERASLWRKRGGGIQENK